MTAELLPDNPKSWPLCATCCERVYDRMTTIHNECNWCRNKSEYGWVYYDEIVSNQTSSDKELGRISRVKNKDGTFRYWLLRMVINGKKQAKVFSESNYGSEEAALRACKQWRERIERS